MGHKAKAYSVDDASQQPSNGTSAGAPSAYAQLTFAEVLEDLSSRFIVNLPAEELSSIERICFQVEQAHWFYEDFLRPLNPSLASFSLRRFSSYLLHTSSLTVPLIQRYISTTPSGASNTRDLEAAFDDFMKYKTRVPVCGVVMLNASLEKCVLVKGWKSSAAWGFPKGKINQQESERDCAVREVLEETGFDCGSLLSSDSADFMELTMREQKIRLYIVPGVDEETHFETLTRKEISRIAWFRLSDLPTWKKNKAPPQGMGGKFYLISPFVGKLKQWIQQNRSTVSHISNSITTELPIAAKSSHSSDELKNLLGLGNGGEMARGPQMIEEQGDARSRQLLDLLRGDVMSDEKENTIASSSSPQPQILDERDRGTAQLLTALNVGAGKEAQVMKKDDDGSNSAMLLSMLKGGDTSAPIPRQDERVFAPLSAPQAHNTSHAQSLLNLISPSHSNTSFISSDPLDKERERARQRDALLSNLMASSKISSPSIQKPMHDARIAQDFHFPPAGSNFGQHISSPAMPTSQESNLLSLLQPPNASKEAPAPAQSPFSSFVQQQTQATAAAPSQSAHIPQDTNNDSTKLLNLLNSRLSQNGNTNSSIFQPPDMISPPMPLFQAGYGPPFPQMAPSSYLPYPGGYPSGLSQHAAPAPFHPIPPPHAPLFYGSTPGHPSHQPTN